MVDERTWQVETGDQYLSTITETQLRGMDEDEQYDFMKQWFLSRYENPYDAGRPIDDEDGRILYFFGGPYEPEWELKSEFEEVVPDEVIEKLAAKFADECHEWDGKENGSYFEGIFPNSKFYRTFQQSLNDVKALMSIQIAPELEAVHCRMLYAHVVTAMETYLSDAFITITLSDSKYIRRFVQTSPEYQTTKVALADVFDHMDKIMARVRQTL